MRSWWAHTNSRFLSHTTHSIRSLFDLTVRSWSAHMTSQFHHTRLVCMTDWATLQKHDFKSVKVAQKLKINLKVLNFFFLIEGRFVIKKIRPAVNIWYYLNLKKLPGKCRRGVNVPFLNIVIIYTNIVCFFMKLYFKHCHLSIIPLKKQYNAMYSIYIRDTVLTSMLQCWRFFKTCNSVIMTLCLRPHLTYFKRTLS